MINEPHAAALLSYQLELFYASITSFLLRCADLNCVSTCVNCLSESYDDDMEISRTDMEVLGLIYARESAQTNDNRKTFNWSLTH